MIAAFKAGTSAIDLSRRHRRPKHVIYKLLERAGLRPIDNMRRGSKGKAQHVQDAIVEFYRRPAGIHETARHFGFSYGAVRKILVKHAALRADGKRRAFSEEAVRDMVTRAERGESQFKIALAHRCSQAVVSRQLLLAGVPPSRCFGARHGMWRGGRTTHGDGYVLVAMSPDHPFYAAMAGSNGYVLEHRLIMAEHLGRPLERHETVHHLDGDRTHNVIENLQHRSGRHGNGIVARCADCGSTNVVAEKLG